MKLSQFFNGQVDTLRTESVSPRAKRLRNNEAEKDGGVEMSRISRIAFAFVFCLLVIGVPLCAQVFTGSISGTVTDSSGAAIPAANLTLRQAGTGLVITTSSDSIGNFAFPSADPGDYTLTIAKDGFNTLEKTGITLQTGQRVALGTIALN